ncbi:MAG: hypothetical protein WC061_01125 [Melioribacteraceae bacterium]
MNNPTDEILNRYIDGELDSDELATIKNEMNDNPELLSKLQALKSVDHSLRRMEVEHAPDAITEKVMKAISAARKSVKPAANHFFIAIISLFSVGVIAVLIAALQTAEKAGEKSAIAPYADKMKDAISKNISSLQSFFSNPGIILTIFAFSLVLLIAAYFTFESHKNFTKKLNSVAR